MKKVILLATVSSLKKQGLEFKVTGKSAGSTNIRFYLKKALPVSHGLLKRLSKSGVLSRIESYPVTVK